MSGSSFWTLRWGCVLEVLEESPFPCLFLLLQDANTPWVLQQHQAESFPCCFWFSLPNASSTCKDPSDYVGSTGATQGNLPILTSAD